MDPSGLIRGMRLLDDIAQDYERTEITTVFIDERSAGRYVNLFSVVEMCPIEQAVSPDITSVDAQGHAFPQVRVAIDDERTLYILRRSYDAPSVALDFFRGEGGHHWMKVSDQRKLDIRDAFSSVRDPSGEVPQILSVDSSMAMVLPRRLSSFRVCVRLDATAQTRDLLNDTDFEKITEVARQYLGIDLQRYSEYFGGTLLCFANPVLRHMTERLLDDGQKLMLELYPRHGHSVAGLAVELIDERATGTGFSLMYVVNSPKEIIHLPNPPHRLRRRLFNPAGDVLFDHVGSFVQGICINFGVAGPTRQLNITHQDGHTEVYEIPTIRYESPPAIPPSQTTDQLLVAAEHRRQLEALEAQREFIYFPPDPSSKLRAKAVVRDLLAQARRQCYICDPFLSANDVIEYALFVPSATIEVRLVGSVWWLHQKRRGENERVQRRYGEELYQLIEAIKDQDPTMKVACRALRGRKESPLHDRFLVIDDKVYLLGSSLNEFGNRATTLFRVPDSRQLVTQVHKWWSDDAETVGLDVWVRQLKTDRAATLRPNNTIYKPIDIVKKFIERICRI